MEKRSGKKGRADKKMNESTVVFLKAQILYIVLSLLLMLLTSMILYSSSIDKKYYFYAAAAVLALTSFLCAYFAGYKIHKNGLVTGLLYSLPCNVIWLLISLIINSFKADATGLIAFAVLVISSMLGGILSVNTKLKAKKIRKGR